MWYVMQVQTGSEEKIRTQCETLIPKSVLQQCFIPYYEEQRKLHGKWNLLKKVLFPGYIFMVTDELDELRFRLKRVQGMTKILGTGDEIVPLTEEEVLFMQKFGGEKQIVEISKGILEGNQVRILSGPLIGKEALIQKIDYHKRRAYLELEMFGRMQRICLGLEVKMEKVEKEEKTEPREHPEKKAKEKAAE
ncbi:MAG: antiterminator LoaP [Lachnospiraceae bacterium]|nr:antiterminator LoaP [Lachnospiraceae bacterium]